MDTCLHLTQGTPTQAIPLLHLMLMNITGNSLTFVSYVISGVLSVLVLPTTNALFVEIIILSGPMPASVSHTALQVNIKGISAPHILTTRLPVEIVTLIAYLAKGSTTTAQNVLYSQIPTMPFTTRLWPTMPPATPPVQHPTTHLQKKDIMAA